LELDLRRNRGFRKLAEKEHFDGGEKMFRKKKGVS
jgi:hypothetical protein